jgi:hypothetical protein
VSGNTTGGLLLRKFSGLAVYVIGGNPVMAQDKLIALVDDVVNSPALTAASPEEFCKVWPSVKKGLELLASMFPKAALIVGIVIAIGDRVCPK